MNVMQPLIQETSTKVKFSTKVIKNIIKNHYNTGMSKVLNLNVSHLAYRSDHNFYNTEKIIISAI